MPSEINFPVSRIIRPCLAYIGPGPTTPRTKVEVLLYRLDEAATVATIYEKFKSIYADGPGYPHVSLDSNKSRAPNTALSAALAWIVPGSSPSQLLSGSPNRRLEN